MCDHRAHLRQLNNKTTNCIVTHKLAVHHSYSYFLNITSVFNLSRASCLLMLYMRNGYCCDISTVSVSYIQGKLCYAYSSKDACESDSKSSS